MIKKVAIVLSVLLVFTLAAAACSTAAPAESAAASSAAESSAPAESAAAESSAPAESAAADDTASSDSGDIKIGFAQATMAGPFYVSEVEAAQAAADAAGVELIVADANEDVAKQNQDVLDMIQAGIDVLILNAVEPDGVAPSLEACAEAGIPIVTEDRFVNGDVTAVIGRDNSVMGELVGEQIVEALGGKGSAEGVILEVMGSGGDRVQEARSAGFHAAVDAEEGITVIQTPYCDYDRSKAVTATQDMIQSNPDIAVVYGHNDDMGLGALGVCLDNDMDVLGAGVDGLMEAVGEIQNGTYIATAANDPAKMGQVAFETALAIAKGEQVDEYIDCGTVLVNADNAAEYYDESLMFVHQAD